jgi:hypothetical protein
MDHATQNASMESCISNCLECHRICMKTAAYCLSKGGKHAEASHIALLLICAGICQTCADAMLLGAAVHRVTCGACAEICRQCAAACESMGNDEAMKACAEACKQCAKSCQQMAGAKS